VEIKITKGNLLRYNIILKIIPNLISNWLSTYIKLPLFIVLSSASFSRKKKKYRKLESWDVRCKPYFIFLVHLQILDKVKSVLTPAKFFFLVMLCFYKSIFCFLNRSSYSSLVYK